MIRKNNAYIPIAAIVLLHMLLYSGMASFTLRQNQVKRLGSAMLPFLACIAVAAWLFPVMARWFREALDGTPSRAKRWRLLPAPLMMTAFLLIITLPGYHAWVYDVPLRYIVNFFLAFQIPAAYHVFFTLAPPGRRGMWFGTGMAGGFVLWRALMLVAARTEGVADNVAYPGLYAVWITQIALAAALLGVTLYGMMHIRKDSPEKTGYFAKTVRNPALRRRTVALLFAASGLVYVMNSFIDIRMFPVLLDRTAPLFEPLQLLAALSCPIIGLVLDRAPAKGFRYISLGCACVFILAPSLAALGDTPGMYRVVHALTAAGQFAILVAFSTVLAGLSASGDRISRLPTLLFVWRAISVIGFLLMRVTIELPAGAAVLLATVMAVGYYLLVKRITFGGEPAVDNVAASASAEDAGTHSSVENNGREKLQNVDIQELDISTIFDKHNLSPREREVARLFSEGRNAAEISQLLNISEYTTKTHLRNIMAKFKVSNRNALLINILQKK